ncbi:hypothetical protein L5515_007477 [Caenorhabditis briggsae]|uniref:Uncharacterized protein n=1 Tax=Caenorhabditis briggsae TaxID=6238 RepID=A0AAE9JJH8_CAEBR|nr:hypothetical protein L5515_007477 [Caenorhabditis briggsae]
MFKFLLGFNVTGFYEREMTAEYTLKYMILYTITMVLALFVTSFGIRVSLSISAYHLNVNRLFCFALSMWLIIFMSKICVFLYHLRVVNISDRTDSALVFLHISAFTRYFYFYFGSATPLASTVERGFATLFLSSYEQSPQLPILVLIISMNLLLALFFTILTVFFEIPFSFVIVVPFAYLLICFTLISVLYKFNLTQFYKLNRYHREQYTLSSRFQLKENIRVLSLLMKMIYAVIGFIGIILAGFTLPILLKLNYLTSDVMRTIVDLVVHCNPLIVIPMTTLFIPEFKKQAKAAMFKRMPLARSSVDSRYRNYREDPNQADVYFDLFKKSIKKNNSTDSLSPPNQIN